MATRRRYKDGGRVPVTDASVQPMAASADEPLSPSADLADDPLMIAVEKARRAEELQRHAHQQPPEPQQQSQTVEEYIDGLRGVSDHKKRFLRENPHMTTDRAHADAMRLVHGEALEIGIEDDTPAMDAYLLSGVRQQLDWRRQRQIENAKTAAEFGAPPTRPELNLDREVERLDNEVSGIRSAMAAADSTPTSVASQIPASMPPVTRRSIPMAAPVSRDVPTSTGRRLSSSTQIHLTQEERAIARNSYTGGSDADKEFSYAQMKARLAKMRADGTYSENR